MTLADRYTLAALAQAKGDTLAATGTGAFDRVPVGADGLVLKADHTQSGGVGWAAAGGAYRGPWTAATTYAVGDLVTYAGAELVCVVTHTSGPSFALTNWADLTTPAHVFNVRLYGAKGDGVTDDTAAIKAAVNAAYAAGVAAGTFYAEVYFPPAVNYLVSGATAQGGSTHGNAQIPLPVHATTAQKFTLVLRGVVDATAMWHWQQTSPQLGGATIRSTLVGTNDGTNGEASVIGGPTPAQGYGLGGLFTNLLVVINGIKVVVPNDPHICGFDLAGVAEANVVNASCLANAVPGTVIPASQGWQFGLRMCDNDNNDLCNIGTFTAEGCNFAVVANEHTVANIINGIYCVAAVEVGRGADTSHGCRINYISAESCNVGIGAANGSYPTKVDVGLLDWEGSGFGGGGFATVNDNTSPPRLVGDIRCTTVGAAAHLTAGTGGYNVNGAGNARVYDMTRPPGAVTAPAVPATTVAFQNPFWRDAMVVVTGGTVSAVAVDGVAQGYTATGFSLFVGTGKTITLTYSVAPTWVWTLL